MDDGLARYVLAHHRDLLTPDENAAFGFLGIRASASRGREAQRKYRRAIAGASEATLALLHLEGDTVRDLLTTRILKECAVELWTNTCPRCGALCRTSIARQCSACGLGWHDTPGYSSWILRSWPRGDDRALCRQVPGVGMVVCVADGAGNSGDGALAAEHVLGAVRVHPWSPGVNEWEIQELLMRLDAELADTGAETTALIAVFGADGVVAAAAGDTRLSSGKQVFPVRRTPRLGSGEAGPATFVGPVEWPVYLATDGVVDPPPERLTREWVQEQRARTGDDATLVVVRPR